MPTIKQLPAATSVNATDVLPISQGGTTKALTVAGLLSSTQPALALASGKLLGRVSMTAGGPEVVGLGTGLTLDAGGLSATAGDHTALPVASALGAADEVVVNSGGAPARMAATALRGLFSAGSGISISGGVISCSALGYSLPVASTASLGGVRVDGSSIVADGSGVISAVLALGPAVGSGARGSMPLTFGTVDGGGVARSSSLQAASDGSVTVTAPKLVVQGAGGQPAAVFSGTDVSFQITGAVSVNGTPLLSSAALPASGGLLATSGTTGSVQAATTAQFEALLTAWLQGRPTAPAATPGWWNNSGNPTYS